MGNFLAVFVAFFVTKPMRSMNDFDQPLPSSLNIVLKASTAQLECCLLTATFRQDVQWVNRRGDRGWLSHGLVVTLPISYSLDGCTLWGSTRDMRIAD